MIKILDSKIKNFDAALDKLLSKRKIKFSLTQFQLLKLLKMLKKMVTKLFSNMRKDLIKIVLLFQTPNK